jgi:hypothetical protein
MNWAALVDWPIANPTQHVITLKTLGSNYDFNKKGISALLTAV